eukprot:7455258-Alexandrium_andersonii.AAC.1
MSASLVGSEMCIRDRPSARPLRITASQDLDKPGPNSSHGPLRRGQEAHPVSYTHLTLPTICSV